MTSKGRSSPPRVRVVENLDDADEGVAAVYLRVTAAESFAADLSIPNQRRRALEVCAERGWLFAKVYSEPKHVGGDLGPSRRPALKQLLEDLATGKVKRVLSRHTDRLWRSTRLQDQILAVFARHNVELWDFSTQHDYRSAHGKFSTIVLGAAAQLEKELTGERIREMKRGKAIAGKPAGGPPPFGYTSQARTRRELVDAGMPEDAAAEEAAKRYPAPRRWYVDEAEASTVKLIFELYLQRRLGARRISDELNERGLRRRSGLLWVQQKVTRIIRDPALAGYLFYDEEAYQARSAKKAPTHEQKLFEGEHEAIIDRDVWRDAQRIRVENRAQTRTRKTSRRIFALTGILRCGACGSTMVGRSGEYSYYQCSKRRYRGTKFGCEAPLIRAEAAEATVLSDLGTLLSSPEFVHDFMAQANARLVERRPDSARVLAVAEAALQAAQRSVERLTARHASAEDGEAEDLAWRLLREATHKRKVAEADVVAARAASTAEPVPTVTLEQTARYLAALRERLSDQPEKTRALLGLLRARHDLRLRARDDKRLILTIRLDAVGGDPLGRRLIVVPGGETEDAPSHVLARDLELPEERETAEQWAARVEAPMCACGCGEAVTVEARHLWRGIPRYRHGHHRMATTARREALNEQGLVTIAQAAALLGVSENSVRRHGAAWGLVASLYDWTSTRSVTVYQRTEVEALAARGLNVRSSDE